MKSFFAVASVVFFSSFAFASNYPPDYSWQVIRTLHTGPVLFARAGSGCGRTQVVGYKSSGPLAQRNPEYIDAVVVSSCFKNNETHTKTSVIRLGREWHGTGYMSEQFNEYNLRPQACVYDNSSIGFAFSANGEWDSLGGANYSFSETMFSPQDDSVNSFKTMEWGCMDVNLKGWDFIISEMKKPIR